MWNFATTRKPPGERDPMLTARRRSLSKPFRETRRQIPREQETSSMKSHLNAQDLRRTLMASVRWNFEIAKQIPS